MPVDDGGDSFTFEDAMKRLEEAANRAAQMGRGRSKNDETVRNLEHVKSILEDAKASVDADKETTISIGDVLNTPHFLIGRGLWTAMSNLHSIRVISSAFIPLVNCVVDERPDLSLREHIDAVKRAGLCVCGISPSELKSVDIPITIVISARLTDVDADGNPLDVTGDRPSGNNDGGLEDVGKNFDCFDSDTLAPDELSTWVEEALVVKYMISPTQRRIDCDGKTPHVESLTTVVLAENLYSYLCKFVTFYYVQL